MTRMPPPVATATRFVVLLVNARDLGQPMRALARLNDSDRVTTCRRLSRARRFRTREAAESFIADLRPQSRWHYFVVPE